VGQIDALKTTNDALAVLEFLAAAPGPQSLTHLSETHHTSKSRMYRLLSTLKIRGFVLQDPDSSRYSFGSACGRLVMQARMGKGLTACCLPALRRLWQVTQETVELAVLESSHAVVIEKLDSPKPVLASPRVGLIMPLHAVSTGKVLLASRTDAEIQRLISGGLERFTPTTPTDPDDVLVGARRVRRLGYAINLEGFQPGVCGVAAPVRWAPGGPVAGAIGACVPASRFRSNQAFLRDQVVKAAEQASEALASGLTEDFDRALSGKHASRRTFEVVG
jgi:IclR family acetate operon transcriptional repressor